MVVSPIPPLDAVDDDLRLDDFAADANTGNGNNGSRYGSSEEQHVWIYCRDSREGNDVAEHCQQTRHLHRIPHSAIPDSSQVAEWRQRLRLALPQVPAPYAPHAWGEFVEDVCALLAASSANLTSVAARVWNSERNPCLLVTDSRSLFEVMSSDVVRTIVADVGRLHINLLLHVVFAADFRVLCGDVFMNKEIACMEPLMTKLCSESIPLHPDLIRRRDHSREIRIRPGIYMQHSDTVKAGKALNPSSVSDQVPDGDEACGMGTFGVRYLALLNNKQCAYCIVSEDGVRAVEANGPWEIINGNVVIGGSAGTATVKYIKLSASGNAVLNERPYQDPIYFPIEELDEDFEPPLTFSECMGRVSESVRDHLLELRTKLEPLLPSAPIKRTRMTQVQAEHKTVTQVQPERKSTTASKKAGRAAQSIVHAAGLRRISKLQKLAAPASDDLADFTCPVKPGFYSYDAGKPGTEAHTILHLTLRADGSYSYKEERYKTVLQSVHRKPKWFIHRDVLVLASREQVGANGNDSGDGTGKRSYGFILRKPRGLWRKDETPVVRVEIKLAILLGKFCYRPPENRLRPFPAYETADASKRFCGILDPDSPALVSPELLTDRVPIAALEKVLQNNVGVGTDDVVSDVSFLDKDHDGTISAKEIHQLLKYSCDVAPPDTLIELREALLIPFDNLAAAFKAIQEQATSQMVTSMQLEEALCSLVSGAGAKEQAKFGKLKTWLFSHSQAFDSKKKNRASAGKTKKQETKESSKVRQSSKTRRNSKIQSKEEHHASKEGNGEDENVADGESDPVDPDLPTASPDIISVFAALNPGNVSRIHVEEFSLLNLHHAMRSARFLEHFQRWLFKTFGRSEESISRAFRSLDKQNKGEIRLTDFVKNVKEVGYGCTPVAIKSIFGFLNLNFNGRVSDELFKNMLVFKTTGLIHNLQQLKQNAEQKYGGVDACFAFLLNFESKLTNATDPPERVSLTSLQKAFVDIRLTEFELRMVLLFLGEAIGKEADGYLTQNEWGLLRIFDREVITGSPSRLRQLLESTFGGLDKAFESILESYLPLVISERVEREALHGLVNAFTASGALGVLKMDVPGGNRASLRWGPPSGSPMPTPRQSPASVTTPRQPRRLSQPRRPSQAASPELSLSTLDESLLRTQKLQLALFEAPTPTGLLCRTELWTPKPFPQAADRAASMTPCQAGRSVTPSSGGASRLGLGTTWGAPRGPLPGVSGLLPKRPSRAHQFVVAAPFAGCSGAQTTSAVASWGLT